MTQPADDGPDDGHFPMMTAISMSSVGDACAAGSTAAKRRIRERNDIWLAQTLQGMTFAQLKATSRYCLRTIKAGVAEARARLNGPATEDADTSQFTADDRRYLSRSYGRNTDPRVKEFLDGQRKRSPRD